MAEEELILPGVLFAAFVKAILKNTFHTYLVRALISLAAMISGGSCPRLLPAPTDY